MPASVSQGPLTPRSCHFLNGKTVRIFGPLQSMSMREIARLIREHGGVLLPPPSSAAGDSTSPENDALTQNEITADWIIIGERQHVFTDACAQEIPEWLTDSIQSDIECGLTRIATETQLLQRLFPSDDQSKDLTALYTPVMLAELLNVTVSDVRRWYQRGLIAPVRVVKRLPYFNLEEVFSARRLSLLLQNGVKHPSIEKKLNALRSLNPGILPLLAGRDLVIQGKNVYLRQNDKLLESNGQMLLDFETIENREEEREEEKEKEKDKKEKNAPMNRAVSTPTETENIPSSNPPSPLDAKLQSWNRSLAFFENPNADDFSNTSENFISISQMRSSAMALDEAGKLADAEEMWRNILFAQGANAEDAFQLGDVLQRQGNLTAARERFSMAIELDENFVEARVNLACVMSELGENELAISALEGALAYHNDYADAYYHLARCLEINGQKEKAADSYERFLQLTDDSCDAFSRRKAAARLKELRETNDSNDPHTLSADSSEKTTR